MSIPIITAAGDDPPPEAVARLEMSNAVVCRKINGYEDYEPLPDATITSEDKLVVYYLPRNYVIKETQPGAYLAHFIEDCKLRKHGEKTVLWSKDKILDYEAKSATPPYRVFLSNNIGLKGAPPGDYDLDITLHDALNPKARASQTVRFKIVAASRPEDSAKGETPPPPAPSKPGASRKTRNKKDKSPTSTS